MVHTLSDPQTISGVIIAGGQGSRVGYQQKALLPYHGQPILKPILNLLASQVSCIWINANAELERFQPFSKHIYRDNQQEFLGPLAGMHAAWQYVETDWAVFVPCDNPNFPSDLVQRLMSAYEQSPNPIVVAFDGERMQPLYVLMHRSMVESLGKAIDVGHLSVNRWVKENSYTQADFSQSGPNAFKNMNTLESFNDN